MNEAQETFTRMAVIDELIATTTQTHVAGIVEEVAKHSERLQTMSVAITVLEDNLGVDADKNPDGSVTGVGIAFQKINFIHAEQIGRASCRERV